jgi:hypothetical protein
LITIDGYPSDITVSLLEVAWLCIPW